MRIAAQGYYTVINIHPLDTDTSYGMFIKARDDVVS